MTNIVTYTINQVWRVIFIISLENVIFKRLYSRALHIKKVICYEWGLDIWTAISGCNYVITLLGTDRDQRLHR